MGDGEYSEVSLAAAALISEAKQGEYQPPAGPDKGKHPCESEVGIMYEFSNDQYVSRSLY